MWFVSCNIHWLRLHIIEFISATVSLFFIHCISKYLLQVWYWFYYDVRGTSHWSCHENLLFDNENRLVLKVAKYWEWYCDGKMRCSGYWLFRPSSSSWILHDFRKSSCCTFLWPYLPCSLVPKCYCSSRIMGKGLILRKAGLGRDFGFESATVWAKWF